MPFRADTSTVTYVRDDAREKKKANKREAFFLFRVK
jgi:hypothetical protein